MFVLSTTPPVVARNSDRASGTVFRLAYKKSDKTSKIYRVPSTYYVLGRLRKQKNLVPRYS